LPIADEFIYQQPFEKSKGHPNFAGGLLEPIYPLEKWRWEFDIIL
jgi:hypothetical protein